MGETKDDFPNTTAEHQYVDAAMNYKKDLRKIFESVSEYTPGTSSDKLAEISALMGKRKKESNEAFDKLTGEVIGEINEDILVQREKVLEGKGGGSG